MRLKKTIYITSLLLILYTSLGSTNEDVEQSPPHVHNSARLLITAHGDNLEIMLESPAQNLFGFEHPPASDSEHQTVHKITENLENAANLFETGDAGCNLENVAMDSPQILAHELAKHADTEAESDFSAFEQSDPPSGTEAVTQHSDVDTTWIFTCSRPDKLEGITLKIFKAFPEGFKHIKVEWDTQKGVGTLGLLQDDTLSFAP